MTLRRHCVSWRNSLSVTSPFIDELNSKTQLLECRMLFANSRERNTHRSTLGDAVSAIPRFFYPFLFFSSSGASAGRNDVAAPPLWVFQPLQFPIHPFRPVYTADTTRRGAQQTACDMFSYSPFPTLFRRPFDEKYRSPLHMWQTYWSFQHSPISLRLFRSLVKYFSCTVGPCDICYILSRSLIFAQRF